MKHLRAALIIFTAVSLASIAVPARTEDAEVARTTTTETVCVKGKGQAELAEKINKMHAEMAAKGFRFVSMTPYSERGEMLGMFLTYQR
jgi:hypothetical protein